MRPNVPEFNPKPDMNRSKCPHCGLVNTVSDELCRRCGTPLDADDHAELLQAEPAEATPKKRSFLKRVTWIIGATSIILVIWYASLLVSSDALQSDQRE